MKFVYVPVCEGTFNGSNEVDHVRNVLLVVLDHICHQPNTHTHTHTHTHTQDSTNAVTDSMHGVTDLHISLPLEVCCCWWWLV